MTEELFKVACNNYVKSYKDFAKEDFIERPDGLRGDEYVLKYFIKGVSITSRKTAKFTFLQRKYYLKKSKVSFKESEKTFSIKLNEESLSQTTSSDKEFIFENYLVIVAYISMFEITNSTFISELENYVSGDDKNKISTTKKERDARVGKQVKTLRMIPFKDGILTKKSVGVVKAVKGPNLIVIFKEALSEKSLEIEVKETDIMYIDDYQ